MFVGYKDVIIFIMSKKIIYMASEQTWTTVIKPHNKLWEVDFKELWRYRDLFMMYVKRDIITMYKQTILGPLWFVIQPAITTIMYMVVFNLFEFSMYNT